MHSIDIGNEGSAFIEVLVGNSSAVRDQDYEVLQLKPSTSIHHLLIIAIFSSYFISSPLLCDVEPSFSASGSFGYVLLHVPH